jgi:hypothetical protein
LYRRRRWQHCCHNRRPKEQLSYRYRRKMGFRPFRTTPVSVAMPGGRTTAGVSVVSACVMPIARPSVGRPLPGFCNSRNFRNFRKRYANARWLGMAGGGLRTARTRIAAAAHSSPPHPEIEVRRGRVQCHRSMALREIIEASEHAAGPVQVGLGRHTPQHCSGTSRTRRARWLHVGRAR